MSRVAKGLTPTGRVCHYCGLDIRAGERAIEAKTKNAWAHFTCWYDGGPFEAERRGAEGER
jgi:hypothetical protein